MTSFGRTVLWAYPIMAHRRDAGGTDGALVMVRRYPPQHDHDRGDGTRGITCVENTVPFPSDNLRPIGDIAAAPCTP